MRLRKFLRACDAFALFDFDDHFDFDRDVAREDVGSNGTACADAVVAEDFGHEFAEAVDDLGLFGEVVGRVDEAENFDDAFDAIEGALPVGVNTSNSSMTLLCIIA